MLAHETLRKAAELIEVGGWSSGTDKMGAVHARDGSGRPVRLFVGDRQASPNPAAVALSMHGAIVVANYAEPTRDLMRLYDLLFVRCKEHMAGGQIHPVIGYNEAEGRTKAEVLAMLRACADELEAGVTVAPPVKAADPKFLEAQ